MQPVSNGRETRKGLMSASRPSELARSAAVETVDGKSGYLDGARFPLSVVLQRVLRTLLVKKGESREWGTRQEDGIVCCFNSLLKVRA